MSIVLATDTYATIRPVIECLRRQTARDRIELVLVAPPGAVDTALAYGDEFARIQIVKDLVEDLGPARAAGVHASSSEWVFMGETHSYPHPELGECLLRSGSDSWSVLMPAVGNSNPTSIWSWAACLSDYGVWAEGRPAGEIRTFPSHNAAYRRRALLALGDGLAAAFALGGDLLEKLQAAGHRARFEPAARIDHLNVPSPWQWARERFTIGMVVASIRLRNWSFGRRLMYLVASPLIAVVLCWRILPDAWRTVRRQRLPLATMFWIIIGTILRAGGELIAYAGASDAAYRRQMYEYEVHKEAFVGGSVSSVERPACGSRNPSIEPVQSECASRTLQTAPSPSQPRPCGT
jgi:hypothetical protein